MSARRDTDLEISKAFIITIPSLLRLTAADTFTRYNFHAAASLWFLPSVLNLLALQLSYSLISTTNVY